MSGSELPNGWGSAPLSEVCRLQYGQSLPERDRKRGGAVKVFGSSGIIDQHDEPLTEGPALILGRKGGAGLVFSTNHPIWVIDTAYYVDDFSNVDQRWLYHALIKSELHRNLSTTAIPSLSREIAYRTPIPLPPRSEQRRIADLIDAAMAEANVAAGAVEAQAGDLDRLEFRIFEDAFPVRPVALNQVEAAPEGWTWQPLTSVARLESGHTPSRRHPEWWGGDTPWIALPDIRAFDGATACETLETINDGGLANSSARLLPTGTVCLSRTASVGFVTVMGLPMATSQDFVNWVPSPMLDSWFLAYALMAARSWIRELASGATHKTIYMPTLKALRICLPELRRQEEIVNHIEQCRVELRDARAALAAQQTAVIALPAAILSAAFRGQL